MLRIYPGLDARALHARREALERFAQWQSAHPAALPPQLALSGVAALYERLPPSSRSRSIDPSGVRAMHRALSVLGSRAR